MARIVLIFSVALAALAAGGCGGGRGDEVGGGDAAVIAAFYPLEFVASEVAGDRWVVRNLTPAGAEPHDLELTAREVSAVQSAAVVLFVGGFMPGLEDALRAARGTAVDVLEAVSELRLEAGDGARDPHVWLDPRRLADIARRVGDMLDRREPGQALARRLLALDTEFERGLAHCERRELVTSHAAFGYLAERYGLEQIALEGLAPETEPAAREVAALAERVRDVGATTVFEEPLVSPRLAETIAREAGAATAVLDPLEGLTDAQLADGHDYFSVMRENLSALREALGCS